MNAMKKITQEEWNKKHSDFKLISTLLDHKHWILENTEQGVVLIPVTIV